RNDEPGAFLWTLALTLTVTHLVALRTATPHFVVFVFVLVFYFRELARRKQGSLLVAAIMLGLAVGLWWLFLATVANRFEHPIMYLPLPFGSLILLWFTRRRWWQSYPANVTGRPLSVSHSV